MSSSFFTRPVPGRLPSSAYAPFGAPIDLPPPWNSPPPLNLGRGHRSTSSAATADTGRNTPPPPYSDAGEDYDRFPAFMDELEEGFYMDQETGEEFYVDEQGNVLWEDEYQGMTEADQVAQMEEFARLHQRLVAPSVPLAPRAAGAPTEPSNGQLQEITVRGVTTRGHASDIVVPAGPSHSSHPAPVSVAQQVSLPAVMPAGYASTPITLTPRAPLFAHIPPYPVPIAPGHAPRRAPVTPAPVAPLFTHIPPFPAPIAPRAVPASVPVTPPPPPAPLFTPIPPLPAPIAPSHIPRRAPVTPATIAPLFSHIPPYQAPIAPGAVPVPAPIIPAPVIPLPTSIPPRSRRTSEVRIDPAGHTGSPDLATSQILTSSPPQPSAAGDLPTTTAAATQTTSVPRTGSHRVQAFLGRIAGIPSSHDFHPDDQEALAARLVSTHAMPDGDWYDPAPRIHGAPILRVRHPLPGTIRLPQPDEDVDSPGPEADYHLRDYTLAFYTWLNAKHAKTGNVKRSDGGYTDMELREFHAAYPELLAKEREEDAIAECKAEARRIRMEARERRQLRMGGFEREVDSESEGSSSSSESGGSSTRAQLGAHSLEAVRVERWVSAELPIPGRSTTPPAPLRPYAPAIPPRPYGQTPRLLLGIVQTPRVPARSPAEAAPAPPSRHLDRPVNQTARPRANSITNQAPAHAHLSPPPPPPHLHEERLPTPGFRILPSIPQVTPASPSLDPPTPPPPFSESLVNNDYNIYLANQYSGASSSSHPDPPSYRGQDDPGGIWQNHNGNWVRDPPPVLAASAPPPQHSYGYRSTSAAASSSSSASVSRPMHFDKPLPPLPPAASRTLGEHIYRPADTGEPHDQAGGRSLFRVLSCTVSSSIVPGISWTVYRTPVPAVRRYYR